MIDPLIRNLQADIALLQLYIAQRQKTGFHDMERMVEALTIFMFRALQMGELKNLNQIKANFPAIDLADNQKMIAVQVTTNASPAKINKTIEAFEKKNESGVSLKDKYSVLYIFGFCKTSKHSVPSYCKLIDTNYLIGELCDKADEDMIQDILDAIRRHRDYTSLHPWDDKDSLEIILDVINRNAIKHRMICEGSLSDMVIGFKEINEVIGKGTIQRKQRSKSIADFKDQSMVVFLRGVTDDLSHIQAIINKSRVCNDDFVCISHEDMARIDQLKIKIANDSSKIAKLYHIKMEINVINL
ncbi:SMEK domain-containing protein [Enterobacter hormaechei]|uniref:SMEK domain-containing protein n=1 Tax=Enterobacterales TaxID=91347 RepID=UPI0005F8ECE4|nr:MULTISPECIES: SMEK domain-containing protein [Enterobacterales]EEW1570376.1 regulator [Escherichia coli]MBN5343861.1 SMEK domain-containing protein [Serratia marcescens]EFH4329238.1 SMEK domain-containing protein [Escherichia coli]KJW94162.1 regulator [Enterobacter hormaechei subsp. steigerwaltii]MBQ4773856.1 SMEK domain-containing protein [Pectobacterium versatile]